MNYHNITKCDILNGEGVRVVLWLSGCSHHCKNCHNAITWNPDSCIPFDEDAKQELFEALSNADIDGITLSGGDPLFVQNRKEVGELIEYIAKVYPQKNIWLYTGYVWEEIKDIDFLKHVDVLIDGKFEQEKFSPNIRWKGSSNQRTIDVKNSLKQGKVILHCE